jgi:hypothetical protein
MTASGLAICIRCGEPSIILSKPTLDRFARVLSVQRQLCSGWVHKAQTRVRLRP